MDPVFSRDGYPEIRKNRDPCFFVAHCFSAMAKGNAFAILVKVAKTFPLKMKGRSSLSEK